MTNQIKEILIDVIRLDATVAELWITVIPDRVTDGTCVRGRVTGPRCALATTVDVSYPLRETSRQYDKEGVLCIHSRVVIPEPNVWDPISPFEYLCKLELWQGDQRCDQTERVIQLKAPRKEGGP
jgi:hypothetical protein